MESEATDVTVDGEGAIEARGAMVTNDDDAAGGAMTGCATVAKGDGAHGRTMLLDFVLAATEGEGGGTILSCGVVFEEVEAGRTLLLDIFLAAARAASLSLLLQVEHVLRGDHSPFLTLP